MSWNQETLALALSLQLSGFLAALSQLSWLLPHSHCIPVPEQEALGMTMRPILHLGLNL